MNELTETKLARPLDKGVMANDAAALRNLVGFLNNPAITGAEKPKPGAEEFSGPAGAGGETIPVLDVQQSSPPVADPVLPPIPFSLPTSQPVESHPIFFTGLPASGKSFLISRIVGAQEFQIGESAIWLIGYLFPGEPDSLVKTPGYAALVDTIRAWGEGELSDKYPITPARATFCLMIRSLAGAGQLNVGTDWKTFGRNDGFWMDAIVSAAKAHHAEGNVPVITGIRSEIEFKYLRSQGFTHYHVMASVNSRGTRFKGRTYPPSTNSLDSALDNDVTKQISRQRDGQPLHCIWNDTAPLPSPRFLTAAQFLNRIGPAKSTAITGE